MAASSMVQGEREEQPVFIFIHAYVEDTDSYSRCLGPLSTRMVSSLLPLGSVSPSLPPQSLSRLLPIVSYFLFGAVGIYGEGRVFFPTWGPSCLHC